VQEGVQMSKKWFSTYQEDLITATTLLESFIKRFEADESLKNFFNDLEKEYFTRFIFESNNMEKEGLPEGDTKKLVFESFEANEFLETIKDRLFNVKYDLVVNDEVVNESDLDNGLDFKNNITPVFSFKRKKKDIVLVIDTLIALLTSKNSILRYLNRNRKFLRSFEENNIIPNNLVGFGNRYNQKSRKIKRIKDNGDYLITEEEIKRLHKALSEDIKDYDNGKPGEYRPESACIDMNTVFLEPSLIDAAMKKWVQDHEDRFKKEFYNPFIEACKLTGDFILIHPFGDFNGRVSRILLNMILQLEGIPFYLVLRSRSKDKKKYLTSMKHYARGKPTTYLSLVCKTFIKEMESINERLKIAGIEPIETVPLNDKQLEFLEESLSMYIKKPYKL